MQIRLFDTHCHLFSEPMASDLSAILKRAHNSGIGNFLVPGLDVITSNQAILLAREYKGIFAAVGFQPNSLKKITEEDMQVLQRMALLPEAVAIGETGLDFHWNRTDHDLQIKWFKRHLDLAQGLRMTSIVHSRDAEEECLESIPENFKSPVIFHCYTGSLSTVKKLVTRGFFIGFTGCLTFRNNQRLRDLLRSIPKEQVLIETDSPYMAPEPVRGKSCEPSYLKYVFGEVSHIWNTGESETAAQLWKNSMKACQLGRWKRTDLVYSIGNSVYVNITGKCNNNCRFCVCKRQDGIAGYYLRHNSEPDEYDLELALKSLADGYGELVFCGYGEPTLRPDLLYKLASGMKKRGWKIRLNTNGRALSFLPPEKVRELLSVFDNVSTSLNFHEASGYNRLCRPDTENAFENILKFIEMTKNIVSTTEVTAVAYTGVNEREIRKKAEDLGVPFRMRGFSEQE